MGEISNTQDIIDSRDVIARIEELQDQDDLTMHNDDREELHALLDLAEEGESLSDWEYGETLIHDNYFDEYAEQLAEDIGLIDPEAGWPLNCIDWERAADLLRQDYTEISFGGEIYWGRS